jgi:hypothetical protein
VQDDIARHFEQHVAEKKDAGAKAVNGFTECELLLHLELREPDIHAIKVSGEVAEEQKRDQSPDDLAEDVVFSADVRDQLDGKCGGATHAVFLPLRAARRARRRPLKTSPRRMTHQWPLERQTSEGSVFTREKRRTFGLPLRAGNTFQH